METLLKSEALSLAIAALPANQRRAWLMREFSASSYVVIAAKLAVPVSTVRGQLARARHNVAKEMNAWR
ncbi:sigma factor-like helix-turn-helix DNA-binding protein [Cryobacterium sp. TMT3-29-2]|uniref:sigma factor-like helix-turn-helix DNA-binding protein n=1 Tax=Cryobacterium sp. TMT3-29-2 TaxID=2555867 RepID=UPI001431F630|nr:sigma factor-like helix-turn-helix DNA-binding protein [Cryobacterium sp. TMT3-29-2]